MKTDEVNRPAGATALGRAEGRELKADAPAATVTPLRAHWSLKPRQKRWALLAASVVLAAGLGGVIGALAAGGWSSRTDVAALNERKALQHSIDQLHKQVATLKGNLDKANKTVAEKTALEKAALDKANKSQPRRRRSKRPPRSRPRRRRSKSPPSSPRRSTPITRSLRSPSASKAPATRTSPARSVAEAVPLPVPRPAPQIGVAETRPVVLQDWTIHGSRGGYVYVRSHGEIYQVAARRAAARHRPGPGDQARERRAGWW